MKPAADRLEEVLNNVALNDMALPVVANVTAQPNSDVKQVKRLLIEQVCAPVLWDQSIVTMIERGVTDFIEIGPGKVLSGLVKRISKDVAASGIEDCAGINSAGKALS